MFKLFFSSFIKKEINSDFLFNLKEVENHLIEAKNSLEKLESLLKKDHLFSSEDTSKMKKTIASLKKSYNLMKSEYAQLNNILLIKGILIA